MRELLSLCAAASMLAAAAEDVPYIRQTKQGCGAAAVAMVMQHWRREGFPVDAAAADPRVIQRAIYDPSKNGAAGSTMSSYFTRNGFVAYAVTADLGDLREQLSQGRPIIVCLRPDIRRTTLHYVVALAIEEHSATVLLHDPARGPQLRLTIHSFLEAWERTHRWALVATPKP